jgi:hypothetical protein
VFEPFRRSFAVAPAEQAPAAPWVSGALEFAAGYQELATEFAGCTFENGLYRVHDAAAGRIAQASIAEAFPDFANRATPFAVDWLGREFAVDAARMTDGEPQVLLLEPGTGEALEIPCGLVDFHNCELVEHRDAALASSFFDAWSRANPERLPIPTEACVGYRVPLFLGGGDTIDNLELVDREVYWSICAQLRHGS